VRGATVELADDGKTVEALSDQDGRFAFQGLRSPTSLVTVTKPGYLRYRSVLAVNNVTSVTLRLRPAGIVTGKLYNLRGRPIVNAIVSPVTYRADSDGFVQLVTLQGVQTNDLGEFRIMVEPGSYFLNVSGGYLQRPALSMPEPNEVPPVLYPGVSRLSDAKRIEVKGTEETALGAVTLSPSMHLGSIRFHVTNVGHSKDVTFDCCVQPPVLNNESGVMGVVGGGASNEQSVYFDVGTRIVRTYWPQRVGRHQLIVRWKDPSGRHDAINVAVDFNGDDTDVSFELVKPDGHLRVRAFVDLADGRSTLLPNVRVNLGRSNIRFLSGGGETVFVPGRTLPPFERERLVVNTGSDGEGLIDGIPPGPYALSDVTGLPAGAYLASASQGNRDALKDGVFADRDSETVKLVVRLGTSTIRGTVRNANGIRIHDAIVILIPQDLVDRARAPLFRNIRTIRTNQEGLFVLNDVPPGEFRLYAGSSTDYPVVSYPDHGYLLPDALVELARSSVPVRLGKNQLLTKDLILPGTADGQ
jgi:hypothetical protein